MDMVLTADEEWAQFAVKILHYVGISEPEGYRALWYQRGSPTANTKEIHSHLADTLELYPSDPTLHGNIVLLWSSCIGDETMQASLIYDSGVRRVCKTLSVLVTALESNSISNDAEKKKVLSSLQTLVQILLNYIQYNVLALRHALKGRMLWLLARMVAAWPGTLPGLDEGHFVGRMLLIFDFVKVNLINFTVLSAAQSDFDTWDQELWARSFTRDDEPRLREAWKIVQDCFEYRRQAFPYQPELLRHLRRQICGNPGCEFTRELTIDRLKPSALTEARMQLIKDFQECSGCSQVQYCSGECQKKHWKTHKPICKTFAAIYKDRKAIPPQYVDQRDLQLFKSMMWTDLGRKITEIKRLHAAFLEDHPSIAPHLSVLEIDYTMEEDKEPFRLRMRELSPGEKVPEWDHIPDMLLFVKYQYGRQRQNNLQSMHYNWYD